MNSNLVNRIVNIGLGLGAIVFVLLLAGVGSGALTQEPTAADAEAYETRPTTTAPASDSEGEAGTTSAAPAGAAVFALSAIDFGARTVTVTNVGTVAGSVDGFWLCNFPTYTEIDGTIDAGGSMDFSFGISDGDGEVGLYSSRSFGDSSAVVSYVEWGSTGHGRSEVAVSAGIWDGGFAPGGAARLVATVPTPAQAADWSAE